VSDTLLTYIIIFAELGGVLLFISLIAGVYFFIKNKKEGNTTKDLISFIKGLASSKRGEMFSIIKDKYHDDDEVNIETLIEDEKQLYKHLVKFSINKDTSLLKSTTSGIHALVGSYVELLAQQPDDDVDSDGDGDSKKSRDLKIKKENEILRVEVASLEARLQNATDTIEGMMSEFSSMYEGGKEGGEQHAKNEMYKLKQKLEGEDEKVKAEMKKKNEE